MCFQKRVAIRFFNPCFMCPDTLEEYHEGCKFVLAFCWNLYTIRRFAAVLKADFMTNNTHVSLVGTYFSVLLLLKSYES
jgi:hypothetical protein